VARIRFSAMQYKTGKNDQERGAESQPSNISREETEEKKIGTSREDRSEDAVVARSSASRSTGFPVPGSQLL
jgi:hypothetical protein